MGKASCDKVGLKKGRWTTEEDQALTSYVQRFGHENWRTLPKQAGKQYNHKRMDFPFHGFGFKTYQYLFLLFAQGIKMHWHRHKECLRMLSSQPSVSTTHILSGIDPTLNRFSLINCGWIPGLYVINPALIQLWLEWETTITMRKWLFWVLCILNAFEIVEVLSNLERHTPGLKEIN